MNEWFVYIIRCTDDSLYTGCTNNLIRRWHQHTQNKGARYLRAHPPEEMVYMEVHPDRSTACKREYEIKQYSRQQKERIISSGT